MNIVINIDIDCDNIFDRMAQPCAIVRVHTLKYIVFLLETISQLGFSKTVENKEHGEMFCISFQTKVFVVN